MNRLIALVVSPLVVSCGFFTLGAPYGHTAENHFFSQSGKASVAKPADGQTAATLTTLGDAENAVIDVWKRLPLTARNVMFVSQKTNAYGGYEKRASNAFAAGENLLSYVEPIGYKWEETSPGTFKFGVTTDFEILTTDGKALGGQRAFQNIEFTTHYRNRELFLSLSISLDGIKPGNYVLAYDIHDKFGAGKVRTEQPFTIKAP
ncbi:MAG: hypothetical protein JWN71_3978 [Xanthobacteraceae bacterium]|nr:hypothetical protein [Xanthobacteraceae bacterium]